MTGPTNELIDDLYREKVRTARLMTPEQKFLAGPRLFDSACKIARDGIRMQHPEFDDDDVNRELRRRLDLARRLENLPWTATEP